MLAYELFSPPVIFKINSIIHQKLSSPTFINMLKYVWSNCKSGLIEERIEFKNVNKISFTASKLVKITKNYSSLKKENSSATKNQTKKMMNHAP